MTNLLSFPTPEAALVRATMATAEAAQLEAQLEVVREQRDNARAERDTYAEQLDDLSDAARKVKRATSEMEKQLALSLLLAKALAIGVEERPCPTCEQFRCESGCPERER